MNKKTANSPVFIIQSSLLHKDICLHLLRSLAFLLLRLARPEPVRPKWIVQIRLNTFRQDSVEKEGIHFRAILRFSSAAEIGGSGTSEGADWKNGISPETDGKRDAADGRREAGGRGGGRELNGRHPSNRQATRVNKLSRNPSRHSTRN